MERISERRFKRNSKPVWRRIVSDRPRTSMGIILATKADVESYELFGGVKFERNGFTKEQVQSLWEYYEFEGELDITAKNFESAGSIRNLLRHINSDGLRVMAFLSKYLEKDEDPVGLVATALIEMGFDVEIEE